MEDVAKNIMMQYGAIGLLIVGMGVVIKRQWSLMQEREKAHLAERQQWYDENKRFIDIAIKVLEAKIQ